MTGQPASERMTVAAFLEWASRRPEDECWELIEREPVPTRGPTPAHAMAAETVAHARIKRRIDHALTEALAKGDHRCEVFVSGPKVRIDADTAFEPDVVVSCVEVPEGLLVPEPLIVVEVLSASTRDRDFTIKLAGYASLTSVAHYLLVETQRHLVVHHRRAAGEQEFRTSIARRHPTPRPAGARSRPRRCLRHTPHLIVSCRSRVSAGPRRPAPISARCGGSPGSQHRGRRESGCGPGG
jgi:Uma2 family endonuclease